MANRATSFWLGTAIVLWAAGAPSQTRRHEESKRATGTLVSVSPMPYSDLKSFVLKNGSVEEKFTVSEAADVPNGLKPGDSVSVEYRVSADGTRWASAVKKDSGAKSSKPNSH